MNESHFDSAVVLYKQRWMYIISGWNGINDFVDSVHCFDLHTNQSQQAPSLNIARNRHSATIVNGNIYVVGGSANRGCMNTIERLDIARNSQFWTIFTIEGLSARCRAMASRLNDTELVIAGGYDGDRLSDAVIVKPQEKTCQTVVQQN